MKAHRVSRRRFLGGTLASFAATGVAGHRRPAGAAAGELVIVGWGGAHEESLKKAVYDPFTAATGIRIKQVSATNQLAMLKAQVQNQNPEWDIIQPGSAWLYRGTQEGLYEKVDLAGVPRADMYPPALHSHGVAFEVYAVDIAYNTRKFPAGTHPKTWAELWDVKRFPGRRTGPGWTPRDNFEAAVMAAGVPPAKVYPIDTRLAFARLADLKPHMTWWQSGAQFAQLFADEEVVLGYGWGARVVVLAREGKPLAVELNQAILDQTFYAVSRIARNRDAAMKFIAFASQPKPQAERPLLYPHGPTNRKAWAALDAQARRDVVNYDLPGVLLRNPEWWMDNETALLEQWKKFLAS
jgi:putative spermidine/putrescine transport system substrate-binding protein